MSYCHEAVFLSLLGMLCCVYVYICMCIYMVVNMGVMRCIGIWVSTSRRLCCPWRWLRAASPFLKALLAVCFCSLNTPLAHTALCTSSLCVHPLLLYNVDSLAFSSLGVAFSLTKLILLVTIANQY